MVLEVDTSIELTFAELAFSLALADDRTAAEAACTMLGVPIIDAQAEIAQAGLASLLVRGLAREIENEVEISPLVYAVGVGLLTVRDHASIAIRTADVFDVTQLLVGDAQSLAVRPTSGGCFRFDALDGDATLADVGKALLDAPAGHEVSAVIAPAGGTPLAVHRSLDGTWEVQVDSTMHRAQTVDATWELVETLGVPVGTKEVD